MYISNLSSEEIYCILNWRSVFKIKIIRYLSWFSLQEIHEKLKDHNLKKFAADIVSVLAMTMSEERECLKYRLLGQRGEIGDWGHEYVR